MPGCQCICSLRHVSSQHDGAEPEPEDHLQPGRHLGHERDGIWEICQTSGEQSRKYVLTADDSLWSDWLVILDNISVWKKGQQEKKEQAARKKASKKDSEPGESKANVAEPEVIEIDWHDDWRLLLSTLKY